jgi:flagellar biosynthesis protein FlhF
MFVKKFEAPSLEQALKMVKSEMGPEALVLSTQEKRSGKLFSRRMIEVTAAIEKKKNQNKRDDTLEKSSSKASPDLETLFPLSKEEHSSSVPVNRYKATAVSKSSSQTVKSPQRYMDIDSESAGSPRPLPNFTRQENGKWEASFKSIGISPERAKELSKKIFSDFNKTDLDDSQFVSKAKLKLLSQGIRTLALGEFLKKRAWVPVGVAGSGKTTLLVKLAILARDQEKSVSLISMDNRKISGRSELMGYSRLIRVPFFPEIQQSSAEKLRLIDSPALDLSGGSNSQLEKLCGERSSFIVLDASARLSELMRQVDRAMGFHPEAIAFTKLDHVEDRGVIYDILKNTQLPLFGISKSSSFKTKFQFLNPTELAQFLIKEQD